MTPLEKDIEKALGRMIGRHGGYCLKWTCPGWAGVPDRLALLPGGRVVFIELKRPDGGIIAARQTEWARRLRELGHDVRFIKNHEEIKALDLELSSTPEEQTE